MLRKLFWFFIILITLYLLLMFKAPSISGAIDNFIGFPGLTESITRFKSTVDRTYTNLPSKEEVYSGAIEFKENFQNGLEITKDKIDDARIFLSGAESKVNQAKETYDTAIKFISGATDKLEQTRDTINEAVELGQEVSNFIGTGVTLSGTTETGTTY